MFVNCKTKKIQSFLFGKMHHQQRHRESAKEHDCFFVELLYYITLLVYYPPYFCRKIIQEQFFEAHIFMKMSRKFPPSSHKCKKIELTFSNNHKDRYSPTRHSFVSCPQLHFRTQTPHCKKIVWPKNMLRLSRFHFWIIVFFNGFKKLPHSVLLSYITCANNNSLKLLYQHFYRVLSLCFSLNW